MPRDAAFPAAAGWDAAIAFCLGAPLRDGIKHRSGSKTQPAVAAITQTLQTTLGLDRIETIMRAQFVPAPE